MPDTPRRDYPYPSDIDQIDVAGDIRRLALAIDTDVVGNPPIQTNDDQNQLIVGNSGGSSNPLILIGPSNNCWLSLYTGPLSGNRAGLVGYPNTANLNVRNERTDGDLVLEAEDGPVHVLANKGNPAIEIRSADGPIDVVATSGSITLTAAGGSSSNILIESGGNTSIESSGLLTLKSETGSVLVDSDDGFDVDAPGNINIDTTGGTLLLAAQDNTTLRSTTGDMLLDAQGAGAIMRFVADTEGMRLTPTVLFVGKTASDYSGDDGIELFRSGRILASSNTATQDNVRITKFGAAVANGQQFLTFYTGTSIQGSITIQSDGSGVDYNQTSDRRLKDPLGPIDDPVRRVRRLRPRTFAWKESGSRGEGFFADEVQQVVPGAVTGEPDGDDPQMLAPMSLIPLLTAALQSALDRVEALEVRYGSL